MIDPTSRHQLRILIQRFLHGEISSEDIISETGLYRSSDEGVRAIWYRFVLTYEEETHIRELDASERELLEKELEPCVRFLSSGLEYEWPHERILRMPEWLFVLLSYVTFGKWGERAAERAAQCGDPDVWPFLREEDYQRSVEGTIKETE